MMKGNWDQLRFDGAFENMPDRTRRAFWRSALALSLGLPSLAHAASLYKRKYVVQRGDTLSHIALRFKTTVKAIKAANGLRGDLIIIGQTLVVPTRLPELKYAGNVEKATRRIKVEVDRWKWIVAHHSAVEAGNASVYDTYHRNVKRIRDGLAYHFVIGCGRDSGDGEIEIGGRWTNQLRGGHVRKTLVNDTGIGICFVGNLQYRAPTRKQLDAFHELMLLLEEFFLQKKCRFAGHKEIDLHHTVCPGRNFPLREMHLKYD
jgi:LysM repeat protein|tara:strand:- start:79 stop:861 length:783 start_codon:yes stop_codon:yes gene_type:complete